MIISRIRSLTVGLSLGVSSLFAAGCYVRAYEGPPASHYESQYEAEAEPPAPQVEVITVRPSPGHYWVRGHWVWYGRRWHWRAGYWRTGCVWVDGYWSGRRWIPGHCA